VKEGKKSDHNHYPVVHKVSATLDTYVENITGEFRKSNHIEIESKNKGAMLNLLFNNIVVMVSTLDLKNAIDKITGEINILTHEPPYYYGYWRYQNAGFSKITRCQKCGNTGLYQDCLPIDNCKHCGGQVVENGLAKWIAPVYSGYWWWKRKVIAGYWKRA
jgi:hypothetical protein